MTTNYQHYYATKSETTRRQADKGLGITSGLKEIEGVLCWVRDATDAYALGSPLRETPDSLEIEVKNTLLRCLSRVRPIDYAIETKWGANGEEIRSRLQLLYDSFELEIRSVWGKEISEAEKFSLLAALEKNFNTKLIEVLHAADLTKGCKTHSEAEGLLAYYRNFLSLLEPAQPLITITYDKETGILQRDIQFPITQKTDFQKAELEKLRTIQPILIDEEANAHNSHGIAFQEADSLFVNLMLQDDRALPAQAGNAIEVGVKNAFIVKSELIDLRQFKDDDEGETFSVIYPKIGEADKWQKAEENNVLWFARTSTPIYSGQGASPGSITEHLKQNIEQIRSAGMALNTRLTTGDESAPQMHYISLDSSNLALAENDSSLAFSYVPSNTSLSPSISNAILFIKDDADNIMLGQNARRVKLACRVVLTSFYHGLLSVIQCDNGQDNTGTVAEKTIQTWMAERYQAMGFRDEKKNQTSIDATRAKGANATAIAAYHVPGSIGMKKTSKAYDIIGGDQNFSKQASKQFYSKSANTRTLNHVDDVSFLKKSSEKGLEVYRDGLDSFRYYVANLALKKDKHSQLLVKYANYLLAVMPDTKNSKLDSRQLEQLNQMILHCNTILSSFTNPAPNNALIKKSAMQLAILSTTLPGHGSSIGKKLSKGLIAFAYISLVAIGILALIPSGGSSLLAVIIGATGLSTVMVSTAAASITTGVLAGSQLVDKVSKETGVASSVSFFRTVVEETRNSDNEDTFDSPRVDS